MQHLDAKQWKYTTAAAMPARDPVGLHVFTTERPGYASIYQVYPDGTRWPARDVNLSRLKNAVSVLAAWCDKYPAEAIHFNPVAEEPEQHGRSRSGSQDALLSGM